MDDLQLMGRLFSISPKVYHRLTTIADLGVKQRTRAILFGLAR
jgi:hypothetical protein